MVHLRKFSRGVERWPLERRGTDYSFVPNSEGSRCAGLFVVEVPRDGLLALVEVAMVLATSW
jgi:hypothetical protein